MMDKDPFTWLHSSWIFGTLLALFGGVLENLSQIAKGKKFNLFEFVVNVLSSGFFGLLATLLCEALNQPPAVIGFVSGFCGFLGTRVFFVLSAVAKKYGIDIDFFKN